MLAYLKVALKRLSPSLELSGYEINVEVAHQASKISVADIKVGSTLDEISDKKVDLTFTAAVLIQII
ncbi:hypothetical protein N9Y31_02550 [Alphaproteobacteria bacterium]|nr:hypothetical protein [Alphaproteobacteria bacterium]